MDSNKIAKIKLMFEEASRSNLQDTRAKSQLKDYNGKMIW